MPDLPPTSAAGIPPGSTDIVARVAAVNSGRHVALDALRETSFDDLIHLAATICQAPIACITFVDAPQQRFNTCFGMDRCEASLHVDLCSAVVAARRSLVIPDTLLDPRSAGNPAVAGDSCIRCYAGVPLPALEGEVIGTLCVMDRRPRQFTAQQLEMLESLGRQVVTQMELRLANDSLRRQIRDQRQAEAQQQAMKAAQSALAISEARARRIFDANVVGFIHWNLDSGLITDANDVFLQMVGYTREDLAQGLLNWQEMTPPEWRERNWQGVHEIRFRRSGTPYEKEYFRKDGSRVPIIIGGALFDDSSNEGFSFILDISERVAHLREIENLNARLKRSIQETHHRVKNNLQIISALVELQAEEGHDTVPAAAMYRIGQHTRSLAAIHDLLTQQAKSDAHTDSISTAAMMGKLVPLLETTTGGRPIRCQADDVRLPVREGASLALLVAEIVSNAVKHGQGDIDICLRVSGSIACLEVCDDGPGFPPNFDPTVASNTGLGLIDSTGRHDLRGIITYESPPEGGAIVSVTFPLPAVNPAKE